VKTPSRSFAVAAALLAAAAGARAQGADGTAPVARPALEILAPTSADTPVGDTVIRVFPKNIQPGDTLDFFVNGRKVGAVTRSPWEIVWPAGETVRRNVITVSLVREGREIAIARVNTREPGFTDRAAALAIGLAPIVTDRSGRYVLGLQRDEFTVLDDGHPQKIETFETVDSPLAAVLVLDVSASMRPKLDDAVRAARAFVHALKPDDRLGLLTFNSGVVGTVEVALDRKEVLAALDAAVPEGDTALYDATAAALRRVKKTRQRRALVVFTDGEDNRSRFSVDQVIELARASEVSVFTVAEAVSDPKTAGFLERLANETGGRAYSIGNIGSLPETFASILEELRSQYYLTYTPSRRKPHTWHSVDVHVSRSGLVVRAKKRYFIP
jgi:Ca-activated chloride channel family protein